ncbi:MAG: hypothetical protein ACK5U8_02105, partial [Deltaproteobacteria bacterium]
MSVAPLAAVSVPPLAVEVVDAPSEDSLAEGAPDEGSPEEAPPDADAADALAASEGAVDDGALGADGEEVASSDAASPRSHRGSSAPRSSARTVPRTPRSATIATGTSARRVMRALLD